MEPEPNDSIGDAFESGWDAFTALLFGIGFVVAATLPFLISGLLLALVAWMIIRRRDGRRPAAQPSMPVVAMPAPEVADAASESETDDTPTPVG